jgi:hypothetical protein
MHAVCDAVEERAEDTLAWLWWAVVVVAAYAAYRNETWLPLLWPVICFVLSPPVGIAIRLLYGPVRARRLSIRPFARRAAARTGADSRVRGPAGA